MSQNKEQQSFEQQVLELPPQYDSLLRVRLVSIAQNILTSGVVSARIPSILRDDDLAVELARGSYLHENGFNKLLLFKTDNDQFHLRLHQWLPQERFEQNIHDHRFNFWSLVISGSLTNNMWERADRGEEFIHYEYRPRGLKEKYEMTSKGINHLRSNESFRVSQGEAYYFDNSWIHTTSYSKQSITVILEDRRTLRPYANVFVRNNRVESDTLIYESPALSVEEFRSHLRKISLLLPSVETTPIK